MTAQVWISLSLALFALCIRNYILSVRAGNALQRAKVLKSLGLSGSAQKMKFLGFFHPYCNAGGGGERVLWTAISHLQRTEPDVVSVVYSGDVDATKEQIIGTAKARFDIDLSPSTLHIVFLRTRYLVEGSTWPIFTLLGQSLGSMYLAWEAMCVFIPDVYIDTMGYAFTFHIASWLGGIPVGAYVHYPTISTDMLARVKARKAWHTNSGFISSSPLLSQGKLVYYRFFMYYYALSLRTAKFLMVNSSWTKNHIDAILQYSDPLLDACHLLLPSAISWLFCSSPPLKSTTIVYPPCDTHEMTKFGLEGREKVILSIAQFRPEKDHASQISALSLLLKENPEYAGQVKLVLVGGSRNAEDAARVGSLRSLAEKLNIQDSVEFVVNAPYSEVLSWLSKASVGLNTMVDEHFGINVVEFMAAGVIPIVHASGGPLNDIVVPFNGLATGFHADKPSDFASAIHAALSLSRDDELRMRERARTWAVQKFSVEEFEKSWEDACRWKDLLADSRRKRP